MMTKTYQPRSVAGEVTDRIGITYRDLGNLLGVSMGTVNSKMAGRSRFTATQCGILLAEYGDDGQALIDAVDQLVRAIQSNSREERMKVQAAGRAPVPLAEDGVLRPNVWPRADGTVIITEDGEPGELTIDEWKARWGEPGLAADRHGRMMGYFATEPEYCE
jgi:hypothetical protein